MIELDGCIGIPDSEAYHPKKQGLPKHLKHHVVSGPNGETASGPRWRPKPSRFAINRPANPT